jgi:hypothetical protein
LVAVPDRLDEQLAQGVVAEELAEDVEDACAKGLALLFELLQQPLPDLAFPRFLGHEVPEVAHLGLADAVDTAEALLQPVGVPGQVVVDHQVGALEVDTLASGVGGHQDLDRLVLREALLRLPPFVAPDATMDRDDGVRPADQSADPVDEVVQGIAVFGEDHQLSTVPVSVEHLPLVEEEGPELVPLAVASAVAHTAGLLF